MFDDEYDGPPSHVPAEALRGWTLGGIVMAGGVGLIVTGGMKRSAAAG